MYRNLFLVCIFLNLQSIRAISESVKSSTQINAADDNSKVKQSANESQQNLGTKKHSCLASFQKFFEFEMCVKLENQLDEMRCKLMNETAQDFCSLHDKFNIEGFPQNVSDLCEKNVELNTTRVVPSSIAFLIDGWKTLQNYGCENICKKREKQYYNVCLFVFNYYAVPRSSSKIETNLINNEGPSEGSALANPPSIDDHPSANSENLRKDNVNEENDDNTRDIVDTKDEIEQKKVDEPNLLDKKADVPKNNPANIDDDQGSKSQHVPPENDDDNVPYSAPKIPKIDNDGESHALSYFALVSGICIIFYLMMYNKKKILALMIEGRRKNVKRRPNGAAYSKLDCNLEEALTSGPSTSTSNSLLY